MKQVIFSIALFAGNLLALGAAAQVSVSVRRIMPLYCPPPSLARVVVVSPPPPPPPARIVAVKPAPVIVKPARPVVVVKPAPPPHVYVVGGLRRSLVIYR